MQTQKIFLGLILAVISSLCNAQKVTIVINHLDSTKCNNVTISDLNPFSWNNFLNDFSPTYSHKILVKNQSIIYQSNVKTHCEKCLYNPYFFQNITIGIPSNIFLTKGDYITATLKSNGEKMYFYFEGKNAAHYNYKTEEELANIPKPQNRQKGEDLLKYKKKWVDYKNLRISFLNDFCMKNQVSKDFFLWAKASIENSYTLAVYYSAYCYKDESTKIPRSYFNDCKFLKEDYRGYHLALFYKYIKYYSSNIDNNIDLIYNNICKKFKGDDKEYLLTSLIGEYTKIYKSDKEQTFRSLIKRTNPLIKNKLYRTFLMKAFDYCMILNRPFPDKLLTVSIEKYGSDSISTLAEVLKQYKNKKIYIDFWASWCYWCCNDILLSHDAKEFLKQKDVVYLYWSSDKRKKDWKNAVKKYNITENQYRLINSKDLWDYLSIVGIPRYIILNNNHQIINSDAPRPIPNDLENLKNEINRIPAF